MGAAGNEIAPVEQFRTLFLGEKLRKNLFCPTEFWSEFNLAQKLCQILPKRSRFGPSFVFFWRKWMSIVTHRVFTWMSLEPHHV